MILAIVLLVLVFALIVIAHEFGHYIVAKRNGIHVYEFGIGFPPKLWGKTVGGTEYTINLIPLGGFVRLEGEDNESQSKNSFATKSFWIKTKVLFAGVAMNLIIAYLLFAWLCASGLANTFPFPLPSWGPIKAASSQPPHLSLVDVEPGSAGQKAGLQTGDTFVSINDRGAQTEDQLGSLTGGLAGQTVTLKYQHEGSLVTKSVKLGTDKSKGILGVEAISQVRLRYPWWSVPIAAVMVMFETVWASIPLLFGGIAQLVVHRSVPDTLVGPVGVAAITPTIIRFGWDYFIVLVASISLSLAILNALPIPALDGGRWFIAALRKLGVPIKDRYENWAHTVAFVLLLLLGIIINVSNFRLFGH